MTTYSAYLLFAALVQVGWLYNMKWLDKEKIRKVRFHNLFTKASGKALLPILLYLIFGISNVLFLTLSMKEIPASNAYAIWTGIVLGIASLIDHFFFGQKLRWQQLLFLVILGSGIIGLKYFANL